MSTGSPNRTIRGPTDRACPGEDWGRTDEPHLKEATVNRFHYDRDDQQRTHLADLLAAYNFACRLKTLSGITPYEYTIKIWTSEPERFIVHPIHQMPELNT